MPLNPKRYMAGVHLGGPESRTVVKYHSSPKPSNLNPNPWLQALG